MSLEYLRSDDPFTITAKKESPVLVDFSSSSCQPCHLMQPELEAYALEHPEIQVICVSADIHPKTTSFFKVRLLPTLILMENGKRIDITIGAQDRNMIARFVERGLAAVRKP